MSTGQSMQVVTGGDRTVPLAVPYGEPKPKPKGLDWDAISPPQDAALALPRTTAEARSEQMAHHTEAIERVERLEGRKRTPPPDAPAVDEPAAVSWSYDRDAGWTTAAESVTVAATPPGPGSAAAPTWMTPEVHAVAATLRETEGSTDMVVSACRAAVIAAADALRGASLRASERRSVRPETAARPRPDNRKGMGQPRHEEKHPEVLDQIRRLYFDEGRGIQWIAAELELSPNTVSRIMHRNGMALRAIGESNENARIRIQARLDALGVTSLQVRKWAADHGIETQERGFLREDVLARFEASR